MSWQALVRIAVAVAITLVVAVATVRSCAGRSAWEERAENAEQFALEQTARADSAQKHAVVQRARADSLARVAVIRGRQVRERVEVIREAAVPDTCRPYTAVRDSLIDEALATADQWQGAYEALRVADDSLGAANGALRSANDSLLTVLKARPKPRSRLLPEIGPYVGVGIASNDGVGVQVGVGFVWRF